MCSQCQPSHLEYPVVLVTARRSKTSAVTFGGKSEGPFGDHRTVARVVWNERVCGDERPAFSLHPRTVQTPERSPG
jgi:hypothetical protein